MRWLLERRRDEFEDVGADVVEVTHGGALVFSEMRGAGRDDVWNQPVLIVAPGEWVSVVPEDAS